MSVLVVVGCRPQFVKSAALGPALDRAGIEWTWTDTGQHYDDELAGTFRREFGLKKPSRFGWDVFKGQDWVVVFGDTRSALQGALLAKHAKARLAHIEAGCRSFDDMPEERNRVWVDRLADLLFCSSDKDAGHLAAEGVKGRVEVVGDVMADAARVFRDGWFPWPRTEQHVLVTVHREANVTDEKRLRRIMEGLRRVGEDVVFPAHPRTRAQLDKLGIEYPVTAPPVGYPEMQALIRNARCVVTDSGGLQKEAYWAGVPCVTLRPSTEWTETVDAGANVLVDDDPDRIVEAVRDAKFPENAPVLYGDGFAADRIAALLKETMDASS